MQIIAFAAAKGGVGKTLLTASLAVLAMQECALQGTGGVGVMDLDPQGSLTHWYNMRPAGPLAFVNTSASLLGVRLLRPRANGLRYLLIDTPPGHSGYIREAMTLADLVVIPIKPGELDLAATTKTIKQARDRLRNHVAVPNDATYRSRAMGQTVSQLHIEGVPTLPPVHHRVGLMLRAGQTLTETDPTSRGAQELAQLWAGIKSYLKD